MLHINTCASIKFVKIATAVCVSVDVGIGLEELLLLWRECFFRVVIFKAR